MPMNERILKGKTFDDILKYVAEKEFESIADQYPPDGELSVHLTPSFEKKMQGVLNSIKRRENSIRLWGRFHKIPKRR
jgi:hypothetical protein